MYDYYENLKASNIVLSSLPAISVASYKTYVKSASGTLYLSGHLSKRDGQVWAGKLGKDTKTKDGELADRGVAIDLISTLQLACEGDLNLVGHIVKLTVLVNSTPDFTEQHLVANGASKLINRVFGSRGVYARSAFGVAQLPLGACVEIEMTAELRG